MYKSPDSQYSHKSQAMHTTHTRLKCAQLLIGQ